MKLLNVSPFKVGSRYKSVYNDFWFEVLNIESSGRDFWRIEYACSDDNGIGPKAQDIATFGSYLKKHYVEVPKDEVAQ